MIPTLEIVHPDLPGAKMIINEADFDPSRHQRYREPKGRKRSPEPISDLPEEQSPEQLPDLSEAQSPEHTPAEPQEQSPLVSDLPQSQSPEPTHDLSEDLSPEQTPKVPEDQPSPTPDLPETQPATDSQTDQEAKNITALRAIAAEKRIPRRMKLSRDELLQAILGVGNGDRESDGVGG